MNKKTMLWAVVAAMWACSASAQPAPEDDQEPPPPPSAGAPARPGRGGMDPMGRMEHKGRRGPELTEAQEKELLGFIQANEPRMHERLSAEKERAPMIYHRRLSDIWTMYQDKDAREHFVRQTKAGREVRELAQQYRKASAADRPALKQKLTAAVGELFDADVSGKELQVRKMQAEIASLKDKIAKRRQMKDKFVAQRVERLSGEGDDWEW